MRPVDKAKFLGINLNNTLSFKNHIDSITNKASRRINVLKVLAHDGIKPKALMKLYKSYIRPIIEHGSIAFISASKNQMERLQMIENNAIKTCLRLPRYIRDSLLHEYASLELLSVRLIRFNKKLLNIMKSSNEHIQALITDHVPANLGILSPLDVIEEMRQFWKVSCSGSNEPAAWSKATAKNIIPLHNYYPSNNFRPTAMKL